MPCKSETRNIRDKDVFVIQWPATKAMAMQLELLTVMGDDCVAFVMGDWTFSNLIYVLQRVEKTQFIPLVRSCISAARINGKEINDTNFDVEFSGDLMQIYSVFSFVLEVNYKDFFEGGLAAMAARKKNP